MRDSPLATCSAPKRSSASWALAASASSRARGWNHYDPALVADEKVARFDRDPSDSDSSIYVVGSVAL